MNDVAEPLRNGRYRLLSVLGAGGMATVFRSWDQDLQVYRAIKVLSPELASRPGLRDRFQSEARAMARLRHRNIVAVQDIGIEEQRPFFVMELLPCGSLDERVHALGRLDPTTAVQVCIAITEALEAAHDGGVIHRDIKPSNVLLDCDGTPKITDFGIARVADRDSQLTKTGAVMGTWAFMAPEQRSDARNVDERADLYGAGATLFSLLTGNKPSDLHNAELHEGRFDDVPQALAEVIKKATRARAVDRFESARALADALRSASQTLPPSDGTFKALVEANRRRDSDTAPPPPRVEGPAAGLPGAAAAEAAHTFYMAESGSAKPPPMRRPLSDPGSPVAPQAPRRAPLSDPGTLNTPSLPPRRAPLSDPGTLSPPTSPPRQDTAPPREPEHAAYRTSTGTLRLLGLGAVLCVAAMVWFTTTRYGEDEPARQASVQARGSGAETSGAPRAPSATPSTDDGGLDASQISMGDIMKAVEASATNTEDGAGEALVVETRPAGTLIVDGVPKGLTPWAGSLPPGEHVVRLESPEGAQARTVVSIESGKVTNLCWDFVAAAACAD